jgi:DNA-binding transcriptional LysR family regulator
MKKLKDINWNQVYYFYEVARKMSMKEAAEVTGVSIPTVSEQIKRLETLLETPLFHRRPRRIELTLEGETLYKHARQMFQSGLRFLDVVSPTVIGGYPVRIGMPESFSLGPAIEFLDRYFDLYSPFGTVHTVRETIADRLVDRVYEGELDWAISLEAPTSPRLEYGKIGSAEIVFCASADALEKHTNRADLFAELPLARSRFDDQMNKLVSDHLQSSDIFVEEIIESDHWDFCLRLVEEGKCVTAVAKSFSGQTLQNGALRTFTLSGPIVLTFYAFWRQSSARMIAIRKLVELLERDHRGPRPRIATPQAVNANLSAEKAGLSRIEGRERSGTSDANEGDGPPIDLPH